MEISKDKLNGIWEKLPDANTSLDFELVLSTTISENIDRELLRLTFIKSPNKNGNHEWLLKL